MGALAVVEVEVAIEVVLELVDALVERLAERDGEELLLDGAMEPLAEAVRLGRADLGAAMLDLADRQEQLEGVLERLASRYSRPLSVSRCSISTPCSS